MAQLWSDGDFQVSANEILAATVKLAVGDRMAPPNHPALAAGYLGSVNGTGAQTKSQKLTDLGTGTAGTLSEDGQASIDDVSFSDYSVTVVRKSRGRSGSDFAKMLDPVSGAILQPQNLAFDAVMTRSNTLLDLIAQAGATFSTYTAGSTTVDLTWATIRDAVAKLAENNVEFAPGDLMCLLHPHQWTDLQSDMLNAVTNEAVLGSMEAQSIQIAQASGYRGRYFGVDFFTSNRVPASSDDADREGCLFAPQGIVWADGTIAPDPHGFMDILDNGKLQIEYARDPSRTLKSAYYNFYQGVGVGDQLRGVKILSDK